MFTRTMRLVVAATLVMGALPAFAASHGVVAKAKIDMQQARQIALQAFPGSKIVNAELEKEGGGSGLRYSFDMKKGSSWREVGVDAITGKVLENAGQGANPKD